jgi:SAM-dependent methyltransferase
MQSIRPHNERAAATWSSAAREYDALSDNIGDSLAHVVDRVQPLPGERFLDIATGTGWTARRLAKNGAAVVGVDFSAAMVEAAKSLAPALEFRVADAEQLPFADAEFDGVTSTFGVMFAARPEDAARELARVVKKGGRLGLATWSSGGTIQAMFGVLRPYMPPPPPNPPPSPFDWGKPERIEALLSDAFDLKFERASTVCRAPSGETVWEMFLSGFGPTKTLAANCPPDRRSALKDDFVRFIENYRSDLGISWPREYLVTIGVRR